MIDFIIRRKERTLSEGKKDVDFMEAENWINNKLLKISSNILIAAYTMRIYFHALPQHTCDLRAKIPKIAKYLKISLLLFAVLMSANKE